ncbi:MAG: ribosome maturation factor RimM [Armatimonadota bacterium]
MARVARRRGSGSPQTSSESDLVVIGKVVSPFGNKGELKVLPLTDFPDRFLRMEQVRLSLPDGTERTAATVGARLHNGFVLLKIEGCATISDAEALRDAHIVVPAEERMPLPQDSYYVDDIVGLRVITEDGTDVGVIRDVYQGPANDAYDTGRYLIPALKQVVLKVDLRAGIMVIRPIPGMLDSDEG